MTRKGMPEQLARAYRLRPGRSRRPLIEDLPHIYICDLKVPKDFSTQDRRSHWERIFRVQVSSKQVAFWTKPWRGQEPVVHRRELVWKRTGFGTGRFYVICSCGKRVTYLLVDGYDIVCRFCHKDLPRYETQTLSQPNRAIVQACKLEDFLAKFIVSRSKRARLQARVEALMMRAAMLRAQRH